MNTKFNITEAQENFMNELARNSQINKDAKEIQELKTRFTIAEKNYRETNAKYNASDKATQYLFKISIEYLAAVSKFERMHQTKINKYIVK